MIRRLFASTILFATLWYLPATPTLSLEANDAQPDAIWTAIIPDAFPRYVYTWRLKADATYQEDGRDASTGTSIQRTLSGRWSREGARMILRQDDQPFVFDGAVLGNLYAGTLYFSGRAASRFCAARGKRAPTRCDSGSGVAIALPPELHSPVP